MATGTFPEISNSAKKSIAETFQHRHSDFLNQGAYFLNIRVEATSKANMLDVVVALVADSTPESLSDE